MRVQLGLVVAAFAGVVAAASAASAQEVVEAGPRGALPAPGAEAPSGPLGHLPQGGRNGACAGPEDRKPHGEVWVGAGTGGYREAGGVVTQPLGDCAQVTIGVDGVREGPPRPRR